MIASLGSDGLVLGVVKGVHGELQHFLVVFLVEEVVGEMVQNYGVCRVDGVRLGEHLDAELGRLGALIVQLDDGDADKSAHTGRVQLEGALERRLRFRDLACFEEAQAHAQPNAGRSVRVYL